MKFELRRVIAVNKMTAISFSYTPKKKDNTASEVEDSSTGRAPLVKTDPLKEAYRIKFGN